MVASPDVLDLKALRSTFGSNAEFERLHPRDRLGRFIETGAEVRIWGGALARVLANVAGGRVQIQLANGEKRTLHRNYLTVTKRPDGSAPTADADADVADMPEQDADDDAPDVTPEDRSVRGRHLAMANQLADAFEDDDPDLADDLRETAAAFNAALRNGTADDEADERAALIATIERASASGIVPRRSFASLREQVEREDPEGQPLTGDLGPEATPEPEAPASDAPRTTPVRVGDRVSITSTDPAFAEYVGRSGEVEQSRANGSTAVVRLDDGTRVSIRQEQLGPVTFGMPPQAPGAGTDRARQQRREATPPAPEADEDGPLTDSRIVAPDQISVGDRIRHRSAGGRQVVSEVTRIDTDARRPGVLIFELNGRENDRLGFEAGERVERMDTTEAAPTPAPEAATPQRRDRNKEATEFVAANQGRTFELHRNGVQQPGVWEPLRVNRGGQGEYVTVQDRDTSTTLDVWPDDLKPTAEATAPEAETRPLPDGRLGTVAQNRDGTYRWFTRDPGDRTVLADDSGYDTFATADEAWANIANPNPDRGVPPTLRDRTEADARADAAPEPDAPATPARRADGAPDYVVAAWASRMDTADRAEYARDQKGDVPNEIELWRAKFPDGTIGWVALDERDQQPLEFGTSRGKVLADGEYALERLERAGFASAGTRREPAAAPSADPANPDASRSLLALPDGGGVTLSTLQREGFDGLSESRQGAYLRARQDGNTHPQAMRAAREAREDDNPPGVAPVYDYENDPRNGATEPWRTQIRGAGEVRVGDLMFPDTDEAFVVDSVDDTSTRGLSLFTGTRVSDGATVRDQYRSAASVRVARAPGDNDRKPGYTGDDEGGQTDGRARDNGRTALPPVPADSVRADQGQADVLPEPRGRGAGGNRDAGGSSGRTGPRGGAVRDEDEAVPAGRVQRSGGRDSGAGATGPATQRGSATGAPGGLRDSDDGLRGGAGSAASAERGTPAAQRPAANRVVPTPTNLTGHTTVRYRIGGRNIVASRVDDIPGRAVVGSKFVIHADGTPIGTVSMTDRKLYQLDTYDGKSREFEGGVLKNNGAIYALVALADEPRGDDDPAPEPPPVSETVTPDPVPPSVDPVTVKGTPEYRAAYNRGWQARGGDALEAADNRREPEAWYDGYMDKYADRPKWSLMNYDSAEAYEAAQQAANTPMVPQEVAAVIAGDAAPGVTGRDQWDNLTPGTPIRVGFEENARNGTFLGTVETDDADRPAIQVRESSGTERTIGLTSFRGELESPRLLQAPRRTRPVRAAPQGRTVAENTTPEQEVYNVETAPLGTDPDDLAADVLGQRVRVEFDSFAGPTAPLTGRFVDASTNGDGSYIEFQADDRPEGDTYPIDGAEVARIVRVAEPIPEGQTTIPIGGTDARLADIPLTGVVDADEVEARSVAPDGRPAVGSLVDATDPDTGSTVTGSVVGYAASGDAWVLGPDGVTLTVDPANVRPSTGEAPRLGGAPSAAAGDSDLPEGDPRIYDPAAYRAAVEAGDWREVGRQAYHREDESSAPAANPDVLDAISDREVGDPETLRIMREYNAGWDAGGDDTLRAAMAEDSSPIRPRLAAGDRVRWTNRDEDSFAPDRIGTIAAIFGDEATLDVPATPDQRRRRLAPMQRMRVNVADLDPAPDGGQDWTEAPDGNTTPLDTPTAPTVDALDVDDTARDPDEVVTVAPDDIVPGDRIRHYGTHGREVESTVTAIEPSPAFAPEMAVFRVESDAPAVTPPTVGYLPHERVQRVGPSAGGGQAEPVPADGTRMSSDEYRQWLEDQARGGGTDAPTADTPDVAAGDTVEDVDDGAPMIEPADPGGFDGIVADGPSFQPSGLADFAPAGKIAKLNANMDALRLLRRLEGAARGATPEEQAVLNRWAGWGGLSEVFDRNDERYEKYQPELFALLNEKEILEARRSTLNAHYSDPRAVRAIWEAVQELGGGKGRILEPGSGLGTFIGFSPDSADMVGVELDSTTAKISRYLYPDASIRNESFAKTDVPDDSFDGTIGNVPFGNFSLLDRVHNADDESIHNHFINKSIDLTRPGGLVSVLTSAHTLDSMGDAARRRMYEKADLVGAIRFPNGAHQRIAETSVVEDLLIFRVREPGAERGDASWVTSSRQDFGDGPVSVNDYWADHPEHVLGELGSRKGQFGPEMAVKGDRDFGGLDEALASIVRQAHVNGLTGTDRPDGWEPPVLLEAGTTRHQGHIQAEEDGTFTQATGGRVVPFEVDAKEADELRTLTQIRDTLSALLEAEGTSAEDTPEIASLRETLNTLYDGYVATYGPVKRYKLSKTGRRTNPGLGGFRKDPKSAIVRALEDYEADPPGGGWGKAAKADIFRQRVRSPRQPRETADSASDALAVSMDTYGEVNLPAIARMLGTTEADARDQLGNSVYEVPPLSDEEADAIHRQARAAQDADDPEAAFANLPDTLTDSLSRPGKLVPAAEYLSGFTRKKLSAARAAAAVDGRFRAHVEALEEVVPADLGQDEIDARIGAAWIDADTMKEFIGSLLGSTYDVEVSHSGGNVWRVIAPREGTRATDIWGTPKRPTGFLIQQMLEQREIKVTYTVDGKSYFDERATLAAQAKALEIQERFGEWLWEDPERARKMQARYNDQFNGITLRSYDNAPEREFLGMSDEWRTMVLPHQRAAVERIVSEPTAMLAHVVGAGKTAEMVIGGAELKRLGMVKKPSYVVPNHMLEQFSREFLEIYPGANVLAAGTADLAGDGRREFAARASTGDWDAVILTQDAFEMIPMSNERMEAYIDGQLATMRQQMELANQQLAEMERNSWRKDDAQEAKKRTIKQMENAIASAEKALRKRVDKYKDSPITFEQTGIDYVFVDEAHEYSNLMTISNTPGGAIDGSAMASDLHMKLDYLRKNNPSGKVSTFATGTPIRNTVTQAYVMQAFLRPDLFEAAGIHSFDQWAATFGEQVTDMELKPEGKGFRQTTRFASFKNVPELLRMFHTFTDVKMAEDLNLKTPELEGGEVQNVPVAGSEALADFINELADRAEAIRAGGVKPEEDNMLNVSTDGRKAALSMALVGGEHEPGKIEAAAQKIGEIYERTKDNVYHERDGSEAPTKGAFQIVFMDLGTPKDKSKKSRSVDDSDSDFNGYDKLKQELVDTYGIPKEKIRYIHEAKNDDQRAELFAAARAGRISVLIGSSQKMGVGTNMQKRAIALHHLDAPWRPADVEQRDGRIMRQGNEHMERGEPVQIYRYITERSFDAYMWQTLERKAKFINQIVRGSLDVREIEDVGDTQMSFAVAKALGTGNMDLLEQAKIDTVVAKLSKLQRNHQRTQTNLRSEVERFTRTASQWDNHVREYNAAIERREPVEWQDPDDDAAAPPVMTVNDVVRYGEVEAAGGSFSKAGEAADAFAAAAAAKYRTGRYDLYTPVPVGTIGGQTLTMQVSFRQGSGDAQVVFGFEGVPGEVANVTPQQLAAAGNGGASARGLLRRVENALESFEARRDRIADASAKAREEVGRMRERIGLVFKDEALLAAALAKQARLEAKIMRDTERDEARKEGMPDPHPFDPRIDTDQYDDPLVGGPGTGTGIVDAPPNEGDGATTTPEFASDVLEAEAARRRAMSLGSAEVVEAGHAAYRWAESKAKKLPEFLRGGGDKPPAIAVGTYVSWPGGRGRVDLVVTDGKVPGAPGEVEGSKKSPAARVTVWEKDGGGYKATGRKIAKMVKVLKRIPPLKKSGGRKDAAVELVELMAAHERKVANGELPASARVTGEQIRAVFDRGVKSWPGSDVTVLSPQQWAVGRVNAFLDLASGVQVKFYRRDADLLAPRVPVAEVKAGRVLLDPADLAAELAELRLVD